VQNLEQRVSEAVRFFWTIRVKQKKKQDTSGKRDQGSRGAATGGRQLDGFIQLVADLLIESGVPQESVLCKKKLDLPGYFRPDKRWDLLVVHDGRLLAAAEFKAHIGPSFGNNFNNRTEEAIGNAADIWTAYREGALKLSPQPWLGYLMFLEKAPGSTKPVVCSENHFPVLKGFQNASYAKRYEIFCQKLIRERLYHASCLLLSEQGKGLAGCFSEPLKLLSFHKFTRSLLSAVRCNLSE